MTSTRVPSPKSVIRARPARPHKLDVGDQVTLVAKVVRRGPWKGNEGLTVEIADGIRHTFYADQFDSSGKLGMDQSAE